MKLIELYKISYGPVFTWIKDNPGDYCIAILEGLGLMGVIIAVGYGVEKLVAKKWNKQDNTKGDKG